MHLAAVGSPHGRPGSQASAFSLATAVDTERDVDGRCGKLKELLDSREGSAKGRDAGLAASDAAWG